MTPETFLRPRMTKKKISGFSDLGDLFAETFDKIFVPPRRTTVPLWAASGEEEGRFINQPGAYVGNWSNDTVPYMVEPATELTSPKFRGEIFAGPAQCAKTDGLIVNWVGYSATTDPQDMIIYNPSFNAARDFSMRRIDRLHRHSQSVGAALVGSKEADNKFDKTYKNGMLLSLSWPTVSELAGKPIGRAALTDYDRMDDDIGGDGNAYDLASKRTTTFGRFAMCLAESSPSREIADYKKIVTGHAAPPTKGGILTLYNRGDRRQWYWPCPACDTYFVGKWEHIYWDDDQEDNLAKAETAYMACPHCEHHIEMADRYEMNKKGRWLKEGEYFDDNGVITGKPRRSDIASFWLMGVAAGLTTWKNLVKTYLDAEDEYENSGEETALAKFFNTDIGVPYIPKKLNNERQRTVEDMIGRLETWGKRKVPARVRFLLAAIDVQGSYFTVQVFGVAPGKPYDLYLVDRFDIKYSDRLDPSAPEGKESYLWVQPGAYLTDWDHITKQVLNKTYELDDDSGRQMAIKLTVCDSGGKAGVTSRAYDYYRQLVQEGWLGRFHLVKGDNRPGSPRAETRRPDADKKSGAGARGEIPVLFLNPTINKDDLDNRLDVIVPGYGMIHLPAWLMEGVKKGQAPEVLTELTSEVRVPGKGWEKVARRNEAWDLFYYAIGTCASNLLLVEKLDWTNPPDFAAPWDDNPLVTEAGSDKSAVELGRGTYDWTAFGRNMG